MKLAIIIAAFILVVVSLAGFNGIEVINHAGGPIYIEVTCMEEGFVKHKGIIAESGRESVSITCPKEGD